MTFPAPTLTSDWPGGTPVTINTRQVTGQDALGNDQYTTVKSTQVNAVLAPLEMKLAPRATRGASFAEELQGEWIVAAGYTCFLPPGTVIGVLDQVIIDGETWRVSARPANWQSPFTKVAGCVQVEINRVTG
jgi:hypothetical protein